MTEKQYAPSAKEKKTVKYEDKMKSEKIKPIKTEEKKSEVEKKIEPKEEQKTESKGEKKTVKKEVIAKEFAIAKGVSLRVSSKSCYGICKMIKGKTPEKAMAMLDLVVKGKLAVKMPQRELPHQKGEGVAGGRFPVNAAIAMKEVVKQLKANADVNGIENPIIFLAKADRASMPFKREGRRSKRTNVYLEARDRTKLRRKGNKLIPRMK